MNKIYFLILIILVFLPVELYFSEEANFTVNSVTSTCFYVITYFSIYISVFLFVSNYRIVSILILIVGFLVIVPINMYYSYELKGLKIKSDRIVNWAHQVELKTNSFPNIKVQSDKRITYTKEDDGTFSLFFYVTTSNNGHFYTPKDGWCFMDD